MCCALAALYVTLAAVWRTRWHPLFRAWPSAGQAAAFVGVMLSVGSAALAGEHISHYLARADEHDRTLMSEIVNQPICSGRTPPRAVFSALIAQR